MCNEEEGDMSCPAHFPCEYCIPYNYYGDPIDTDPLVFAWHVHDYVLLDPLAWPISVPIISRQQKSGIQRAALIKPVVGKLPSSLVNWGRDYRQFRRERPPHGRLLRAAVNAWKDRVQEAIESVDILHKLECSCSLERQAHYKL